MRSDGGADAERYEDELVQFNVANMWEVQSKRLKKRAGHTRVIGGVLRIKKICEEPRAASLSRARKHNIASKRKFRDVDQYESVSSSRRAFQRAPLLLLVCENNSSYA